jgi:uncharacterized membrane protein YkoI
MTNHRKALVGAILATFLVAGAAPAKDKDRKSGQQAAIEAVRQGRILPLAKILAIAAQREPGQVIKVELETKRVLIYEVKVLTPKGAVRELEIDAGTGKILEVKDD